MALPQEQRKPERRLTPAERDLAESVLADCRTKARNVFSRMPYGSGVELDELASVAVEAAVRVIPSWEDYCQRHGYDPRATQYRRVWVMRRVDGALLDYLRSCDPLTRTVRGRVKKRQEAILAGEEPEPLSRSDELDIAMLMNQLRLDAPAGREGDGSVGTVLEDSALQHGDPDSELFVSEITRATVTAMRELDVKTQVLLALRYVHEMELLEIRAKLELSEHSYGQMHDAGVLAIHAALLHVATSGTERVPAPDTKCINEELIDRA